jgi:ABC-2 type transport system permease protein
MNGFLYDIKRTLSGKFTIIVVILLVLVTAATAYGAGISSDTADPAHTDIVLPYINDTNGVIHVSDYIINGYGQPVSGLSVTSSILNIVFHASGKDVITSNTSMSENGYANFTFNDKNLTGFIYKYYPYYKNGAPEQLSSQSQIVYEHDTMNQFQTTYFPAYPSYNVCFNDSTVPVYAVLLKDKSNPSQVNTMVYVPYINSSINNQPLYISDNITSSPVYGVTMHKVMPNYAKDGPNSGAFIYTTHLTTEDLDKYVNIYITNKTGAMVIPNISYMYTYVKPGVALQDGLALYFGILLIPILGIFSAYFYYSKDKASGVLESIIARPITKGKLMISRFTGNSVSFLIGLLISFGLADIILEHYTGIYISAGTFTAMFLGYLVEAIAFAGIMYLITQFEKTQGEILGTGIALLFILGFMWTIVSGAILFLLRLTSKTSFLKDLLIIDSISPSYFPDIISDYHLGVYSTVSASSVGINIYSVVLIGLAWVLIPSLLALYFARKRD